MDIPLVPEQLKPTEREEPPIDVAERLIEIGQRQREPYSLAFYFGNKTEVGVPHPAKLLGEAIYFFFGHGDKTPVSLPGSVVDGKEEFNFLAEATQVDWSDSDILLLLEPLHTVY